jgi:hypothetical protein
MVAKWVPAFFLLLLSTTFFLSEPQAQEKPSQPAAQSGAGGSLSLAAARNNPPLTPVARDLTIDVTNESNALLKVADQVSQQLRVPVAYEEPAWIADSDLISQVDVPAIREKYLPSDLISLLDIPGIRESAKVTPILDPKVRVAGLGTVSAKSALREGQDAMQVAADLLQVSLSDHARRGNPGIFRLVSVGGYGFSIVPEQIRGEQGQWVSTMSPLDARISFPAKDRTLGATLDLIASAVSEATGIKVQANIRRLGVTSVFEVASTPVGAQNEVARDVLAKAFREMREEGRRIPMMWWNLEYLIGHESNKYAYRLNIQNVHYVTPEKAYNEVYWPENKPTQ